MRYTLKDYQGEAVRDVLRNLEQALFEEMVQDWSKEVTRGRKPMLSKYAISRALLSEELIINPLWPDAIQPASIDVHLDSRFLEPCGLNDPAIEQQVRSFSIPLGGLLELQPGQFLLGSTLESIRLGPNLVARLEGKSSLGRRGLLTHATAGFIDPGFRGTITLELHNLSHAPLVLRPGMAIGQLCFFHTAGSSGENGAYGNSSFGSHYQDQNGPTASRSHQNFRVRSITSDTGT